MRARDLGEALEVGDRTIYRDIRDLALRRAGRGRGGVGYVLRAG